MRTYRKNLIFFSFEYLLEQPSMLQVIGIFFIFIRALYTHLIFTHKLNFSHFSADLLVAGGR